MKAEKQPTAPRLNARQSSAANSAPLMQPVDKVLDLVADANRMDDPWFWRDRWAD